MERLREVSQAGAPALSRSTRRATRYEHSIGVAFTAERLGLPLEHQIVCLLHDVTHTAFSHTVDYLLGDTNEATHERQLDRLCADRELVGLLGANFLEDAASTIVEKPGWLKILDALDYTVRDLEYAALLRRTESKQVLESVQWDGSDVVFGNHAAAIMFVRLMSRAANELYLDHLDLYRHHELAAIMREGLNRGVIRWDDILLGTDRVVISALETDAVCRLRLEELAAIRLSALEPVTDEIWTSKMRVLDPLVATSASAPKRLTEVDSKAVALAEAARQASSRGKPKLILKSQTTGETIACQDALALSVLSEGGHSQLEYGAFTGPAPRRG